MYSGSPPHSSVATLSAHASQGEHLERLGATAPDLLAAVLALNGWNTKMGDDGADDHACAEDNHDPAVAARLLIAWTCAEGIVSGENLDEDGAQLASAGTQAMAGGSVAGGKDLGGDHVGGGIGALGCQSGYPNYY